ncbi:MAG: hypothetical protein H6839_08800 [Planctomycetes bacterium]|nr:hypothetical protein [Planctomycetota bacterium]
MSRTSLLAPAALALLLGACGGGEGNNQPPPQQPHKSRLVAFEPGELGKGIEYPDFTDYWQLAEQRNGNVFPVKASIDDDGVLVARLSADGKFAARSGNEFQPVTLIGLVSSMSSLAEKHKNDALQASSAAMILFADNRAPYTQLLELCRGLVPLLVRNLWLVSRDSRDDTLRLLPLKVDTSQVFNEWDSLPPEEAAPTLQFAWRGGAVRLAWFDGEGDHFDAKADTDWRSALSKKLPQFAKRAQRVRFDLPTDATVKQFAEVADLCAPLGYADIEPYWRRLEEPPESAPVEKRRELAAYEDKLEIAKGLDIPTLADFWRVSAGDRGLPPAAEIDPKSPMLGLRAMTDGTFATRSPDEPEWTQHADDLGVLQAFQRNAGEIDFDTGLSELQVVMAMDRNARWETFLGVLEMMRSVGVHRLFVVTNDVLGPTLRLLDMTLPKGDLPTDINVAAVLVKRDGPIAEGKYDVTFLLDGEENKITGPRFSSSLASLTTRRKANPDVLGVSLPRDEPFETLFTILNSVALLGMHSVRIGG